jgi:hypothetical protein
MVINNVTKEDLNGTIEVTARNDYGKVTDKVNLTEYEDGGT